MPIKFSGIIAKYVSASNKHDVKAILSCFADNATVRDEGQTLRGQKDIEGWITKTIEKYKFHVKPLGVKGTDQNPIVTVQISGTFPGSPIDLDYHFAIDKNRITSLTIG